MTAYGRGAKDLRHRIALTDRKLHDRRGDLSIARAMGRTTVECEGLRLEIDDLLELRYTLNVQLLLIEPVASA